MNRAKVEKFGVLAAARKSALLSQTDMANIIGCNVPTLVNIEKEPKFANANIVKMYFDNVGLDGKQLLVETYPDFLLA